MAYATEENGVPRHKREGLAKRSRCFLATSIKTKGPTSVVVLEV